MFLKRLAITLLVFPCILWGVTLKTSPQKTLCQSTRPQHARPLVVLDAGHGGADEGAKIHFFQEKKITLQTVLLVKKYLDEIGYRVILTRSRDVYIPLNRRVAIANKTRAVAFVSVHYNSSQSREASGIEIFYYAGKDPTRAASSKKLAGSVLAHMIYQTEGQSRGVKAGNFHVIRETDMPSILVEGGFMSNLEERMLLKDKKYIDKIAKGIAGGVDKYLRNLQ